MLTALRRLTIIIAVTAAALMLAQPICAGFASSSYTATTVCTGNTITASHGFVMINDGWDVKGTILDLIINNSRN